MPDLFPRNEVLALTLSAEDMVVNHLFCSYGACVNVKTGQPVCARVSVLHMVPIPGHAAYVASQSGKATFSRYDPAHAASLTWYPRSSMRGPKNSMR